MNRQWKLLPYIEGKGQQHMDLDNQLLDCHSLDPESSILRFYRWTPAALSLGFHQKTYPDRWKAIAKAHSLDIVRRPSGGRAVLHQGDLTYAIVTDARGQAPERSHRQIYEYLCEFLIRGFAELGLELNYGKSGRGYIHNPSCFSTATNADLVIADGRKLIGSAQVYRRNSVLQHGSIAIAPNHDLLREIFATNVPIVGYQELITEVQQSQDVIISKLISVLTQAARQHFQAQFL